MFARLYIGPVRLLFWPPDPLIFAHAPFSSFPSRLGEDHDDEQRRRRWQMQNADRIVETKNWMVRWLVVFEMGKKRS